MERLYLNGHEVDVNGVGITFTLKSNLLGEFGRIVAGSSQTVKLPRTVKNMYILGIPEIVSKGGSMARRKLSARLERNGVAIIEDGEAVLLSVSEDGYEIGITYGVVSFLSLVKEGGNLDELTDNGESLEWNSESLVNDPISSKSMYYGFGRYDNGVNDLNEINVHPVVSIGWVLSKIEQQFGFSVVFDEDDNDRYLLYERYILLTKMNNSIRAYEKFTGRAEAVSYVRPLYEQGDYIYGKLSLVEEANKYGISIDSTSGKVTFKRGATKCRMSGTINVYEGGTAWLYILKNYDGLGVSDSHVVYSDDIDSDVGVDFNVTITDSISEGDYFTFVIKHDVDDSMINVYGRLSISDVLYQWNEDEQLGLVTYPTSTYPIVVNLPSMKITDFIQLCGVLTGRFPLVNNGDKDMLRMVKVEDLLSNKGVAVDWSDKWNGEPETIEYKYLDAMKNYIRWEADEDVEVSDVPVDGYVSVEDETLEKWNDLIKLPLGASNGNVIPQYSLVDGKLEENSVNERILVLDYETNQLSYSSELYPQTLVDTVLSGYQRLVREPIIIKGTFRLTELDIRYLDYVKPVYLRQIGRYYGIIQVQYKGDESVVELMQLPI